MDGIAVMNDKAGRFRDFFERTTELIGSVDAWAASRWKIFISLTGLAFWRWGWASLQFTRAAIYRGRVFPRIQKKHRQTEIDCLVEFQPALRTKSRRVTRSLIVSC